MFKKLVSNLPFSPSLIAQLGFYAARLRKEQWMRRLGLVFTVFALIIQGLAVFNPPQPANAASANDLIPGGCRQSTLTAMRQCILDNYNANTNGYRDLLNWVGITSTDIANAKNGGQQPVAGYSIQTKNYQYSFGHQNNGCRTGSITLGSNTFFYGPYNCGQQVYIPGLYGTTSAGVAWAIDASCGNLLYNGTMYQPCKYNPSIKENDSNCHPPTPPSATCDGLSATPSTGTAGQTQFVFHIGGSLYNGAQWNWYSIGYNGSSNNIVSNALNADGSGGKYGTGAEGRYTFANAGTYTVQGHLSTTNAGGDITSATNCVKTVTVNAQQTPDFSFAKTVSPTGTVQPGGTLTYTLTFKNTGSMALTGVVIKDVLPAHLTLSGTPTTSPSTGVTGDLFNGGLTVANVAIGQTVTITYSAKVDALANLPCGSTPLTNNATATSKEDATIAKASQTVTVNKTCTYTYTFVKSTDSSVVQPGGTINYTLTFTNTGNQPLTNVVINDNMTQQAHLTLVGSPVVTPATGVSGNLFSGGLTIASVAAGQTVKITYSAKVDALAQLSCGSNVLTNTASATSKENTTVTKSSTTVTVSAVCNYGYDLTKKVDKSTANPGDTLTYTLTFTNTGNRALTSVKIDDKLPANVTLSGTPTTSPSTGVTGDLFNGGLTIASVAAGQTVTVTYKVVVASADAFTCGPNDLTNTATATAKEVTETSTDNNSATTVITNLCGCSNPDTAQSNPACTTSKAAFNNTQNQDATAVAANAGDRITYTITYANTTDAAQTVTINDPLGDSLEYADLTDAGGGTFDNSSQNLTWDNVSVDAGKSVTRTFVLTVKNPIPAMAQGVTDPMSFDCKMTNVATINGTQTNVINVPINCPAPKVVEQVVNNLPRTGAGTNMLVGGIIAAIVVFFYARSRQLGKEVRLVRKEYAVGTL